MRRLALALALILAPLTAAAQDQATLVADSVAIEGDNRLVAEGGVEVFYKGARVTARRIVFDADADRLVIDGPITLRDAAGTVVLADQADLSTDLNDGILRSARMVFDEQLQLAASEVMRIGGRYTRLGRTVASSCKVCAGNPTPLWEIRAARVIHDAEKRQIYFDNAALRFAGVPVIWLPRLRMPDPTLDRATGVLRPRLRSQTGLGTGIEVPYFIAIGEDRDLTLSPFVTTDNARQLTLRYRQAFRTGAFELTVAAAQDDIRPGETRGYLTTSGSFRLPQDFQLTFFGTTVSDPGYLRDYDVSDDDRLFSRIQIARTRAREDVYARLDHIYSLRDSDVNARLPTRIVETGWTRRIPTPAVGGVATLSFRGFGSFRSSEFGGDGDGDGAADGRDITRGTLRAEWQGNSLLGPGIVVAGLADLSADIYAIRQDDTFGGSPTRLTGGAGVDLRWPLSRTTAAGASQVIEPVVQLLWSRADDSDAIPNEDGVLAEFDEASLFAFTRLPGRDAVEEGFRANLGVSFTHYAPAGWQLGLTLGRVIRARDSDGDVFSAGSGLSGGTSDWLAAVRLAGGGLSATGRLVFSDDFDVTKGELRLSASGDRYSLGSTYLWSIEDLSEGRADAISELVLDGTYRLTDAWAVRAATRYDFNADRASRADAGVQWRNECLKLDLSLSRRFTSSTSVQPTTGVDLSVELLGFGGSSGAGPARACRG